MIVETKFPRLEHLFRADFLQDEGYVSPSARLDITRSSTAGYFVSVYITIPSSNSTNLPFSSATVCSCIEIPRITHNIPVRMGNRFSHTCLLAS